MLSLRFCASVSFAAACASLPARGADAPALKLAHGPDAVYMRERSTFVFRGRPGAALTAAMGGAELARATLATDATELNVTVPAEGRLVFTSDPDRIEFSVAAPNPRLRLSEQFGRLCAQGCPVILAAEHLAPPKHDRRWETLAVIRSLLADTRPAATNGVLFGAGPLNAQALGRLDRLSGLRSGFWRHVPPDAALYEIHGMITRVPDLPRADLLVVALSTRDLERGMDPLAWAIHTEWLLQSLRMQRPGHLFLVAPALSADDSDRFAHVLPRCRLSALSNRAQYVAFHHSESAASASASAWMDVVMREVARKVRCR